MAAGRLDHASGCGDRQRDVGQERVPAPRRAGPASARASGSAGGRGTRHPGSPSRPRRAPPRCRGGTRQSPMTAPSGDRRLRQDEPLAAGAASAIAREQVGLILARDRRQRGGLAEPGPAGPAASSTWRAPAPRASRRSGPTRSRTARAAAPTGGSTSSATSVTRGQLERGQPPPRHRAHRPPLPSVLEPFDLAPIALGGPAGAVKGQRRRDLQLVGQLLARGAAGGGLSSYSVAAMAADPRTSASPRTTS